MMIRRSSLFIFAGMIWLSFAIPVSSIVQAQNPTNGTLAAVANNQASAVSITRFASDDFFAGVFLNLDSLVNNARFQDFPVDSIIPSLILLERFESAPLSELAIFVKDPSGLDKDDRYEVAVAARLKQPTKLETLISRWHAGDPWQSKRNVNIQKIQDKDWQYYRVPTGTFLNVRGKFGELRFTDRDGKPSDQGVSTGSGHIFARSFFEGATQASAVFTFDELSSTDLIDGQLRLALRPGVFRIGYSGLEFAQAEIFLRRPDKKRESVATAFTIKSNQNHSIVFPRKISTLNSDGEIKQVDLVQDLMVDGKLEVVLVSRTSRNYFGVRERDLNITTAAAEYVIMDGDEFIVAQSLATLKKMKMANGESELAKSLNRDDREILFSANIRNNVQRTSLNDFLAEITIDPSVSLPKDARFSLSGNVTVNGMAFAQLRFDTPCPQMATDLKNRIVRFLASAQTQSKESASFFASTNDSLRKLVSLMLPGVSYRFPADDVDRNDLDRKMAAMMDDVFGGIALSRKGKSLTIDVYPPDFMSDPSRLERYSLALLDGARARRFFKSDRPLLGEQLGRRIPSRFPDSNGAWLMHAHQLTFNQSREFDGYEKKYQWFHRGIDGLLDGADQNPESSDLIWMTAYFMCRKIGLSDERSHFRDLFSRDTELHQRLSKLIDISDARSADGKIDNWLVAKLLFQYCIDEQGRKSRTSSVSPFMFLSRPAAVESAYARSLEEEGKFDEATQHWDLAKRLIEEFGSKPIRLDLNTVIIPGDADEILPTLDRDDPSQEPTVLAYDTFRRATGRIRIGQLPAAKRAKKLRFEANKLLSQNRTEESLERYREAMVAIVELTRTHPTGMKDYPPYFADIAEKFRELIKTHGKPEDETLAKQLGSLIELQTLTKDWMLPLSGFELRVYH